VTFPDRMLLLMVNFRLAAHHKVLLRPRRAESLKEPGVLHKDEGIIYRGRNSSWKL
jgi:hypothetical protein